MCLVTSERFPDTNLFRNENGMATPTMNIKNGCIKSQNRSPFQG